MRIVTHDRLYDPITLTGTRVVVYDDLGNPIALVVELSKGHFVASTAGDSSFKEILRDLGITQTVLVDVYKANELPKLVPGE